MSNRAVENRHYLVDTPETAEIKRYALEVLRADLVGIANIERFANAPLRMSPQGIMPAARSVIVMAVHHPDAAMERGGLKHPQEIGPYAIQYSMNWRLDDMSYRIIAEWWEKNLPSDVDIYTLNLPDSVGDTFEKKYEIVNIEIFRQIFKHIACARRTACVKKKPRRSARRLYFIDNSVGFFLIISVVHYTSPSSFSSLSSVGLNENSLHSLSTSERYCSAFFVFPRFTARISIFFGVCV